MANRGEGEMGKGKTGDGDEWYREGRTVWNEKLCVDAIGR